MTESINPKAEEKIQERIVRLLEGRMVSQEGLRLSKEQLRTLSNWNAYYQALPSSKGGKIKLASIWSSLFRLRDLGLYLEKPFEQATTEDLVSFFETQFNKDQIASRTGSKIVIRQFYKWLGFNNRIDDPRLKIENTRKSKITPKSLPTKDELLRLLEGCPDYRSKTIIMLSYGEAGMRAGEIVTLTRDSIEFDQLGAKLWINKSKSNERYVRLVDTEPYMRRYLELEYELKGETSNSPLFYGQHRFKGEWLLPTAINQIIQRAKVKAGITKRLWCHGGRHASISRCHKLGLDVDIIAKRHGITAQTVRNTYLHFDDKDVDEAYLEAKGVLSVQDKKEQEKEKQKLSPKKCPRCSEMNPAEAKFCSKCGMVLTIETAYQLEEARETGDKVLSKALDSKGRVDRTILKEVIKEMIQNGELRI